MNNGKSPRRAVAFNLVLTDEEHMALKLTATKKRVPMRAYVTDVLRRGLISDGGIIETSQDMESSKDYEAHT